MDKDKHVDGLGPPASFSVTAAQTHFVSSAQVTKVKQLVRPSRVSTSGWPLVVNGGTATTDEADACVFDPLSGVVLCCVVGDLEGRD